MPLPGNFFVIIYINQNVLFFFYTQGTVRGKTLTRVAISTCDGNIKGVIFDTDETYYIDTKPKTYSTSYKDDVHFLYRYIKHNFYVKD